MLVLFRWRKFEAYDQVVDQYDLFKIRFPSLDVVNLSYHLNFRGLAKSLLSGSVASSMSAAALKILEMIASWNNWTNTILLVIISIIFMFSLTVLPFFSFWKMSVTPSRSVYLFLIITK